MIRRMLRRLRRRQTHVEAHWWDIPAVPDPDRERWHKEIDKAVTVEGGGASGHGVLISELLGDDSGDGPW